MTSRANCSSMRWEVPTLIDSTQPSLVIRGASIASGSDFTAVTGNTIAFFDSTLVPRTPFYATFLEGRSIGAPSGDWTFTYPRLAVVGANEIHMLWAEPGERPVRLMTGQWPDDAISIWHATYSVNKGWSAPDQLVKGRSIQWEDQLLSPIHVNSRGELILAVNTVSEDGVAHSLLLHYADGNWHIIDVPVLHRPDFIAAVTFRKVRIVATILSEGSDSKWAINLESSDVSFGQWTSRRLVAQSRSISRAQEIRAVTDDDASVAVLWLELDDTNTYFIHSLIALDGTEQWDHDSVSLGKMPAHYLHASATSRSGLLVSLNRLGPEGVFSNVTTARYDRGWHVQPNTFPELRIASQALGTSQSGDPVLVLLGQHASASLQSPLQTYLSTLNCGR